MSAIEVSSVPTQLHRLGIADGAALIERGALSPVDWVSALLDRIAALDCGIDAFLHVCGKWALEQARKAEREITMGGRLGPLHGVPFALKDLYDTAGIPTTGHSRIAWDRVPASDSAATAALYGAGAVLLGKLATHEFAHGGPSLDLPRPPARNPWNADHFAGSSSSGSGAAVAAGFVPAALGTDTGGSIRIPAGLCGIAGLKPTHGLVSRRGVIPLSHSLDCCGPMAWTSHDCALLLDAIAGHDHRDPSSSRHPPQAFAAALGGDLKGLRIGVIRHFWERDLSPPTAAVAAVEAALDVLQGLGAQLNDVAVRPLRQYNDVRIIVQEPEAFAIHQTDLIERPGEFGRDFLGRILAACVIGAHVQVQASRERRRMTEEMTALFDRHDALVTIGAGPAPRFDAAATHGFVFGLWGDRPNLTSPFSVTGVPALSVCTGFTEVGMPLSMQIAGRPFDDAMVLRIGDAYERATPWRGRRPALAANAASTPLRLAAEPQPSIDDATRRYVDTCAELAGLHLSEDQRALLYVAAPRALEIVRRIGRDHDWRVEPASIFTVDPL